MKKTNKTIGILVCSMFLLTFSCSFFNSPKVPTQTESVTSVSFVTTKMTVETGSSDYLKYSVQPIKLQNAVTASWDYDKSIISINPDKYGVVISGLKAGQSYLKVNINNITATAIITVTGDGKIFESEPYIYSNFSVVELTPGSNKTVSVSLYGGTSSELEEFVWELKDPTLANISYSRGNCIITAKKSGSTQLTVTHSKAEYTYTMIVYVYTDNFTDSYITTGSNVITINKTETASRTVSVELKNPTSVNYLRGFSWQVISNDGKPASVSVAGNGESAILTPLEKGLSIVRVTHDECLYPLDILVRVTTTIKNVYITPSTTTLEVIGSVNSYSVYAQVSGTDTYVNPDSFIWTVPAEAQELFDYASYGNCLTITGKKNGAIKVKVSHELSEYSREILIVLREQIGSAIDSSLYITTSSNYIQTKVGADTTKIAVTLTGGERGDETDLVWKIDNGSNNDICKIETPTGIISSRGAAGSFTDGYLYITPLKTGTATVTVTHPKIANETEILIKVYSQYAQLEEPIYITSDVAIIRLLNGLTKELKVSLTGKALIGDENGITWESSSPSSVSLSPSTGSTTIISASGTGINQTYISATHSKAAAVKKILVLTADSQQELDVMKGIYADITYQRLNAGTDATLSLNHFGLSEQDIQKIKWTTDNPSICIVNPDSSSLLKGKVSGISSGTATVSASLAGSEPCSFFITVVPHDEPVDTVLPQYLTTQKNALVIPEKGGNATLSVTGVNISDFSLTKTRWTVADPSIIDVTSNGAKATVTALKEGKTKISVTNDDSSNKLSIDVKVGALYEWEDDFVIYITTEEDVITLVKGATKTIGAALENSTQTTGFSWSVSGKSGIVNAVGSYNGTCVIEAKEAGITELTIRNSATPFDKQILVVVANSAEELQGAKFLSTTQNVVTVGKSLNSTVTVAMKNSASPVLSGYHWTVKDANIASVESSGQVAVVYGKNIGTTKVLVTNDECDFPLEIIVNIVDPTHASENPYISSVNIITLTVGDEATTLSADLIGGTPSDNVSFRWIAQNNAIVSLYSSNETARVKAVQEGVTQLVISHPKAQGIDRTILVICEPKTQSNCYITVSEPIIKMSPTDKNKSITATLINGDNNDKYNFKWWADSYNIVEISYTGETALISPIATGTVNLHVSHPKSPYTKDIVLTISQFSEFAFETDSKQLSSGVQTFVNMQVPSSNVKTKVAYSAKKTNGANASDLLTVGGTNSVCIIDPHTAGTAIITADLIAVNSGIVQASCQLLVSIASSTVQSTYINYPGSTIIHIEKGVTKTLSATLAGFNAQDEDSKAIQWKSSDPSVIKLSPSSASGVVTNNECQITAVQAGKECTITISHEKAKNDIILYIIIPGINVANITLDRREVNLIQGDNPISLTASISNAEDTDYTNLKWTVAQDSANPAITLSGSGKKVSIIPKNIGQATITATVPSSSKSATCTINVEQPKSIKLSMETISLWPGEGMQIKYTVSPESETGSVIWTTSDSTYVVLGDDKKGILTIVGDFNETLNGIATVTGTTKSKATASITVKVGWGNVFSLDKSLIKSIPVDNNDGTFTVNYEVKPSCAELRIWGMDNMKLKDGTYDSLKDGVYTMRSNRHTSVDKETGLARGSIRFTPTGESNRNVIVQAYNNSQINGGAPVGEITTKQIQMNVFYNTYTFLPQSFSSNGNYARFDSSTGSFIIGDGEQMTFALSCQETNGTPQIDSISFEENQQAKEPKTATDTEGKYQYELINQASYTAGGSFIIEHNRDYGKASGNFYSPSRDLSEAEKELEQYNKTVRLVPLVGTINVKYRLFGISGVKEYRFPLYVEVRNCNKTYR